MSWKRVLFSFKSPFHILLGLNRPCGVSERIHTTPLGRCYSSSALFFSLFYLIRVSISYSSYVTCISCQLKYILCFYRSHCSYNCVKLQTPVFGFKRRAEIGYSKKRKQCEDASMLHAVNLMNFIDFLLFFCMILNVLRWVVTILSLKS